MRSVSLNRNLMAVVAAGAAMLGLESVGVCGVSTGAAAAVAKPPRTVTATRITRRPGTLASGKRVRSADIAGQRVFLSAKYGFALASVASADYSVATTNGGRTWRTDGPALHLDAAQAPLAVEFLGAVDRRILFVWGGGQVIDTTSDGGRTWYSALFTDGSPVAVARGLGSHLVAFVGSFTGASVSQYVSKDGGRTWQYQTTVGR
jgi:hypothetical protein